MGRDLPAGTVTFLFSDIEGSTKLLHELGPEGYGAALAEHRRALRDAFAAHDGVEVDTQGDALFVAFPTAPGALAAAAEGLKALADGPIRVRMGLHTGTPHLADEGYVGLDVHRAARIAACGHGGQVLVSAATAALVAAEQLHDLGEHRLKDLSAPERIYQLGNDAFAPLKSLHGTNLPTPPTPFLGREQELKQVAALLSRGGGRLLTLTGPGGTGKTRLGLQAAAAAADDYPHGVWWVPLAPLREAALVFETAEATLGAKNGLDEHIGDKHMLVFFDNFEQVIDATNDVSALLSSCPNLQVLVTSREPLHISGEQEYAVPPLAADESVEFFVSRARAVKADFVPDATVNEICRHLDDLPLALELAAARVKVLSSQQILTRLARRLPLLTGGARDLPERQRTLRATIEWSFELLTPDERELFARLAVFRGGATLDAMEDVTGAFLDTVQSLVDKSLLRQIDDRLWMLETIREYATERLDDVPDADHVRQRHAEHFLALAEEADPYLYADAASVAEWLPRLRSEHDNLRAALDWLQGTGDAQSALRLAGALEDYWDAGYIMEGRRRLDEAIAADSSPTPARARAVTAAAGLAVVTGDLSAARAWSEEGLVLNSSLKREVGAAQCRHHLAYLAAEEGDWAGAQQLAEQVVAAYGELGEEHLALYARRLLAWTCAELGERARSRQLHEENLRRAREINNLVMQAGSLGAMSTMFAMPDGNLADAAAMLRQSLHIWRDLGNRQGLTLELSRCAEALRMAGRPADAAALLACADAVRDEFSFNEVWVAKMNSDTWGRIRQELDADAVTAAAERGRGMALDDVVDLALDLLDDLLRAG
ncbi:MAG: hypothetical protein H0U06_02210 [Solirubrobacterales bacterium]|nr:hypothetical protein [Solirubrobacterales bacterium]